MDIVEIIFWFSFGLIVYCYFGYPLIISIIAKLFERKVHKTDCEPSVSVLISVWNEEDVIASKIENLLSLDYPKEKIQIVVGSDGSNDRTNEIVESFQEHEIRLLKTTTRKGKMAMLNHLVAEASHEIIILADARQPFEKDALRQLVANFSDETIGCVSGQLKLTSGKWATGEGINLYWHYEKFIRMSESRVHSMLGATGAICAIRKKLFIKLPEKIVLDDMYTPLKIVLQGYRAIYDETAIAYDQVAESPKEEYRRKTRTLAGNYQIFELLPQIFVPWKSPVAIQVFSHKYLRLMVPFLMLLVMVSNLFLLELSMYRILFALQLSFYGMAAIGVMVRYQKKGVLKLISKLCYAPYVFCLLNAAAVTGLIRYLLNNQNVTWEKARDADLAGTK